MTNIHNSTSTPSSDNASSPRQERYDYIVVGSGAGGAPLASRLARAGKRVLVIEAGSNHTESSAVAPENEVSRVPLLHAVSTEHPELAWRFFVNHYKMTNGRPPDGIATDPKTYYPMEDDPLADQRKGIFYPRASGIGGCTIHNAMITIAGPSSDWDELASFLHDPSWAGNQMRAYFKRLENNGYSPAPDLSRRDTASERWQQFKNNLRFLRGRRPNSASGNHGFDGWLHTSFSDYRIGLDDKQLVKMIAAALRRSKKEGLDNSWTLLRRFFRGEFIETLDPNHSETQRNSPEGLVMIPLSIFGRGTTIHQNRQSPYAMLGRRSSPREFLLETLATKPNYLTIKTDCLVTEVILEDQPDSKRGEKHRAIGVKYQQGKKLYQAHVNPTDDQEPIQEAEAYVHDNGEVILCGGTFNTPQLLMLSGIGDRTHLEEHQIECKVDLPSVGKNLQDRYEVSVVSEMKNDFSLLDGARFEVPGDGMEADRHLQQWREEGSGLYASNGSILGIFKRSDPTLEQPDLFIFGIPGDFRGYQVGYSKVESHRKFTWVILKSHSQNRDGYVRLRSKDPRKTPEINFNYFNTADSDQRSDRTIDADARALINGVEFVRGILKDASKVVDREVHPGTEIDLRKFVERDAWGHHACGTCRMGPDGDNNAVLDSRFRVRCVDGLRVVDASIFPKIPGYFIVSNIYMASEKAADVILEDAASRHPQNPHYPRELMQMERKAIARRRTEAKIDPDEITDSLTDETDSWTDDISGLAISGGGIRSATLGLGVIQGLAKSELLKRVDFMSTVSGGGYVGSFLGRIYDRLRSSPGQIDTGTTASDIVQKELTKEHSPMIAWLRSHGNYIAPYGGGGNRLNFATFFRNLLSVHLLIAAAALAVFGLANAFRFVGFENLFATTGLVLRPEHMPIGFLVQSLIGPWFSPWLVVAEFLLFFLVVPRIFAFWSVSTEKHETFHRIPLFLLFVFSGLFLFLGVRDGLQLEFIILALSILSTLIQCELAWYRGRQQDRSTGTGGPSMQRARTLNYLTYDLGLGLAVTGAALLFVVIDSLGYALQEHIVAQTNSYRIAFASAAVTISAGIPFVRWIAGLFKEQEGSKPSFLGQFVRTNLVAGTIGFALIFALLVVYSFASHTTYSRALESNGHLPWLGLAITLVACILTILAAFPSSIGFVNRSSLSQVYAARLAGSYLGASNPARHRSDGRNITDVIPGDDVDSIRDYRPHESGGPFHIFNLILNQTIESGSRLVKSDRKGTSVAVSPLGLTVGEFWHAKWTDPSLAGMHRQSNSLAGLQPIGRAIGTDHPLIDQFDRSADRAEMLPLRRWMAISGAAVDPGQGRTTKTGTAFLMGLVNLRTGYWWNSGIPETSRTGFPNLTLMRRVLYLIPKVFVTQFLLAFEWLAKYPGPWWRYWHLGDGGFFENLGAYELIRRRVPRIIIIDSGADPEYKFDCLGELIRKARIDFATTIRPWDENDFAQVKFKGDSEDQTEVPESIGLLSDINRPGDGSSTASKRATLLWAEYQSPEKPKDHSADDAHKKRSLILYIKATMTGGEPIDVANYAGANPTFPHEATADQVFDEAQWESYRKLGEHASKELFPDNWFWRINI
ncbi:GMC family oxidoreductase N-terminal domain-containing protein [Stieleria sp. JC731]|uniref:GMC oxidoreductase n=1 Tax=Pirellulaceae TaxID=2691357 RepID=UPI001E282E95|nr:GMC oxidoreductase [Stieleria sp. JC731]MCC9600412.1 GMC family oxidoreductase N-terminal domain-containing protein [Stieleria sp. JC731]